jgi:hypothetical protein
MRIRILLSAAIAAFALLLVGCAAPVEVPFADACNLENDGKTVITTGSFASTSSVYCSDISGEYRCGLDFVGDGSDDIIGADVVEGEGRNQAAPLPDSYSDADIKITTADGTVIGLDTPARITGKMIVAEGVCAMYVDKVEVVP